MELVQYTGIIVSIVGIGAAIGIGIWVGWGRMNSQLDRMEATINSMKEDITGVKQDVRDLRGETKAMETNLRVEIGNMERGLQAEIHRMGTRILRAVAYHRHNSDGQVEFGPEAAEALVGVSVPGEVAVPSQ